MDRSIQEQYELVKQLLSSFISEGNKLPYEYRERLCQEFLQEMLKNTVKEQRHYEIAMLIEYLQFLQRQ